ncbi:recombinase family protein [Jannaschia sp. M317]|uniref:recombinase family protein n=1 Tax=Jannaschia sp. M317 TaxID=2867011 RepID=UPI0021A264F4|nr:recombinase family protein [Jannaschia sp. M317]UWQ17072.1 recombinase family protein [Jannaschia sp. M317]
MIKSENKMPAFAYLRTSSATNTGADKDSDKRQLSAIEAYAKANGYTIKATYYDAAVSGTDPIDQRPGMMDLLEAVLSNGTRTILVESPDRFARDVLVQELGYKMLKDKGIDLIPTTSPDYFGSDTPTAEMVRTILGAVAAFDRRTTVDKLKAARDRASERKGRRVEGRKPVPDATVNEAKRLYRRSPKTHQRRSLRQIANVLAEAGHTSPSGQPYTASSVKAMLQRAGVYQAADAA